MAKSIFKILKDNRKIHSDLLEKLSEYMSQGGFSKSETDKFICKNYLLNSTELTDKWNLLNPDKKKQRLTFCGQVSVLSNKFYYLFNTNADELEKLIIQADDEAETSRRIIGIINSIGVESEPLASRFDFTLQDYVSGHEVVGDYKVSECVNEIQLLRMMDKQNLEAIFSQVDKDKLAYVMRMMRADLLMTDVIEHEQKDKNTKEVLKKADGSASVRRVCYPVINEMKMALILEFNAAKAKKLRVVKKKDENQSKNGVLNSESNQEILEPASVIIEEVPKVVANDYGLKISQEQLTLITEKLSEMTSDKITVSMDWNLVDSYKDYLESLTVESDIEELELWLKGLDVGILDTALNEMKNRG